MSTDGSQADVLNSWKEIAVYLGRGVRTVQRWEANLGLPVHRPNGHMRSAVFALRSELDLWLRRAPQLRVTSKPPANGDSTMRHAIQNGEGLRDDWRLLLSSFRQTAQVHQQAVEKLMTTIANLSVGARQAQQNTTLVRTPQAPHPDSKAS